MEKRESIQNFVSLHKNIEENYEVDMEEQNQVAPIRGVVTWAEINYEELPEKVKDIY